MPVVIVATGVVTRAPPSNAVGMCDHIEVEVGQVDPRINARDTGINA